MEYSAARCMRNRPLVNALAGSLIAGEHAVEPIVARSARTLGRQWRWLRPLAKRFVDSVNGGARPRLRDAVEFHVHDPGFAAALARHTLRVAQWITEPQQMRPAPAA